MPYWILHIADPHFSRSYFHDADPKEIGKKHATELKHALLEHDLLRSPFHAIVLSGDFTFAYEPAGFTAAEQFVREIHDLAPPRSLIVIPGNHDVDLDDRLPIEKLSVPVEKERAERKFRSFLQAIGEYIVKPNNWLSVTLRLQNRGEPGLVLLGLNSCRVERRDCQGWGYVGLDQVYTLGTHLLGPLDSARGRIAAKEKDTIISITHHNLLPIWDFDLGQLFMPPGGRKYSFTIDAASVLHVLSDLGVGLLLHGHTHWISRKHVAGYGTEQAALMPVLGAGSIGFFHSTCKQHHVQVLEVGSDAVTIYDLTTQVTHRNEERRFWTLWRDEVAIAQHWERDRAQRALQAIDAEAGRAQSDWQVMESWSRLRASRDPDRWPAVLERIHQQVRSLPGGQNASQERIAELIQELFKTPPDAGKLLGLTLHEYLRMHL